MKDLFVHVTVPVVVGAKIHEVSHTAEVPSSVSWPELKRWKATFNNVSSFHGSLAQMDNEIFQKVLTDAYRISYERAVLWRDAKFEWQHRDGTPYDTVNLEREYIEQALNGTDVTEAAGRNLWFRITIPLHHQQQHQKIVGEATVHVRVPDVIPWPDLKKWAAEINDLYGGANKALNQFDLMLFKETCRMAREKNGYAYWPHAKIRWLTQEGKPYDMRKLERERIDRALGADEVIEQLLQEMPEYRFLDPDSKPKDRLGKDEVALNDIPCLVVGHLEKFEELIKKDFKYVKMEYDPIEHLRSDWDGDVEGGALDDVVYGYYRDMGARETIELDQMGALRIKTLTSFIAQASEPGDKLVKAVARQKAGYGLFILCPKAKLAELERAAIQANRIRVEKELE